MRSLPRCVPRPCILAADEGYNQEWSTELTVQQAQDEYIKAWCALKVMSKVYGFGDPDGFVFNMSVGYDLDGIKGRKVNTYINNMMDAGKTDAVQGMSRSPDRALPGKEKDFIASISPRCFPQRHGLHAPRLSAAGDRAHRKRIFSTEKHLHTFVKCNPTILGYKTARTHPRLHGL